MSVELLNPPRAARVDAGPLPILLVISSLEAGGAERQVVEIARRLDRARFSPLVCSLSDANPLARGLEDTDCELVVIRKRAKFDFTVVQRLRRLIRERDIRLVHAFLFDAEIAARLAAPRHVAVISSERNADYRVPRSHAAALWLTRRRFDLLVANSEAGKRFAVRAFNVPAERVRVVRNGVDVDVFRPVDADGLRKELRLPPSAPIIGMIAAFKRQKRHADFFAVAQRVLQSLPECRFVCAGEPLRNNFQGAGDYHAEMRQRISEMKLEERVLFLGRRSDVPEVLSLCDLTILPSEHEGTPNALLESLACERPVITTRIADNAQIAEHGVTGFLCDVGDVEAMSGYVRRLLEDNAQRRAMGRAGRLRMETEFSCAAMTARMQAVYEQALALRAVARA